jgi:hypothetical protein
VTRRRTLIALLLVLVPPAKGATSDSALARVSVWVAPKIQIESDTRWVRASVDNDDPPTADIRYHVRTNVPSLNLYVAATAMHREDGPGQIPLDEETGIEIVPDRALPSSGSSYVAHFVGNSEDLGLPARQSETLSFLSPEGSSLSQDVHVRVSWRSERPAPRGDYVAVVRLVAVPCP